jgi:hypothetical protein
MVTAVRALEGVIPGGATVLVPERKVMFQVAWHTRAPARRTPAPVLDPQRSYRLLIGYDLLGRRRATAGILDRLRADRPPGVTPPRDVHPYEPNAMVLVTEPTFQWLLERVPPAERAAWLRWETR